MVPWQTRPLRLQALRRRRGPHHLRRFRSGENHLQPHRLIDSSDRDPRLNSPGRESRPGRQSGDLQGLSSVEGADSESVGELIEEGNAFEANVVAGVEDAGNANEKEVRTHEVPEDDVPGEYLDLDEK